MQTPILVVVAVRYARPFGTGLVDGASPVGATGRRSATLGLLKRSGEFDAALQTEIYQAWPTDGPAAVCR